METLTLPDNIIITRQIKDDLQQVLAKKNYSRVVVLTDSNTRLACYPKLNSGLPKHDVIEITAGEQHKNLTTCASVWQSLTDLKVDRRGVLIVLGGGVPGDLGGFCAATYKRGIDFILLPTTLLAQVDASVGGKLGVDFNSFKNHIGVFQEPVATIIDIHFLETLPAVELRSGFAEVIKHCLLSDQAMWNVIRKNNLNAQDWPILVKHSVAFKARITKQDPKESGLRKILNFGHTVGHAIESYFLNSSNPLLHGEAIAIGMIAESWLAKENELLSIDELNEIQSFILNQFDKVKLPSDKSHIVSLALQDKKNVSDRLLISVPNHIGSYRWDLEIKMQQMVEALNYYENL